MNDSENGHASSSCSTSTKALSDPDPEPVRSPQSPIPWQTRTSTVALLIYPEWYWWRGFPRLSEPWGDIVLAPTDADYTENAFPSRKPDIDVCGVPRRSRAQRGWYQVSAFASASTSTSTSTSTSMSISKAPSTRKQPTRATEPRARTATPADVPPELFQHILDQLDTRGRARCGGVCRYWATQCQRALFHCVDVRARGDVRALLGFMDAPTSRVARCVFAVRASAPAASSGDPWFHHLSPIKDRFRQGDSGVRLGVIELSLSGPLPPSSGGPRSLRSIHHALPRSLPHFSRHIDRLTLTDMHFAKLDDLMHLVWELPDLWLLACTGVAWGAVPAGVPRRRRRKRAGFPRVAAGSVKVEVGSGCGPRAVEAAVWLSTCLVRREHWFLGVEDLERVVVLARAVDEWKISVGVPVHVDAAVRAGKYGEQSYIL